MQAKPAAFFGLDRQGRQKAFHAFAAMCILFLWAGGMFPRKFAVSVFSPTDPGAYPLAYNEDHYFKVLGAARVWGGEIPIRDYRYIYGPLDQLVFSVSGAFGGYQPAAFDAIAVILVFVAYFFFFRLVSPRVKSEPVLYCVLLLFVLWDGKYFAAKGVQYAELMTLVFGFAAFYFLERSVQTRRRGFMALASACSLLAILGKQEFAVSFAGGITLTGVLLARQKKAGWGAVAVLLVSMAAAYPAFALAFSVDISKLAYNLIPPAASTETPFYIESSGNSFQFSPLAYSAAYYFLSILGILAAYSARNEDPFLPGLFAFSFIAPFLRSTRRSLMGIYTFYLFVPAVISARYQKVWAFCVFAAALSVSLFAAKTYIPANPAYDPRLDMVVGADLEAFFGEIGPSENTLCIPYCSPILAGSASRTKSYEWWTVKDFYLSAEDVDSTLCTELREDPPDRVLLHTLKADKLEWVMDDCMKSALGNFRFEKKACYRGDAANCVEVYVRK